MPRSSIPNVATHQTGSPQILTVVTLSRVLCTPVLTFPATAAEVQTLAATGPAAFAGGAKEHTKEASIA
jgi:hypothetical protein